MKSDLINIFNRLTSSELADYNLFDDLLENHYEKFRYLYSLIENINLDKVDQIYCKTTKKLLKVIIELNELTYITNLIIDIDNNRNNYTFSNFFKLKMVENDNKLLIEIGIKDISEEVEMYASRFI